MNSRSIIPALAALLLATHSGVAPAAAGADDANKEVTPPASATLPHGVCGTANAPNSPSNPAPSLAPPPPDANTAAEPAAAEGAPPPAEPTTQTAAAEPAPAAEAAPTAPPAASEPAAGRAGSAVSAPAEPVASAAPVAAAKPEAAAKPAPKPKPDKPKPEKPKAKAAVVPAEAPADAKVAWWPATEAGKLNIVFVGDASFTKAIAILTDGSFDNADSANKAVKVTGAGGHAVAPKWLVATNKKMLLLDVDPGKYTVTIGAALTDGSGKTVAKSGSGPVYVR